MIGNKWSYAAELKCTLKRIKFLLKTTIVLLTLAYKTLRMISLCASEDELDHAI